MLIYVILIAFDIRFGGSLFSCYKKKVPGTYR